MEIVRTINTSADGKFVFANFWIGWFGSLPKSRPNLIEILKKGHYHRLKGLKHFVAQPSEVTHPSGYAIMDKIGPPKASFRG